MTEAAPAAPFVALDGVTLRYPGAPVPAVRDMSFAVARGEVVTLLGPSGCGKTTALRIVAGLELPDSGSVSLGGTEITNWAPERRRMGFVFQNYALFPHLSVAENVAFGLRVRRAPKAEISAAVAEALDLVDLAGYETRRIDRMSGGQQQRVALARALAIKPDVLLLDEPLSNLDASLREQTREALREVLAKLRVTTFFVTHDQAEAFAFSDRIVLMRAGSIVEIGRPERLYLEPESRFTAQFLGGSNLLTARSEGDGRHALVGPDRLRLAVGSWAAGVAGARQGAEVTLVARPEALELAVASAPNALRGRIVDRVFLGASYRLSVAIDGIAERVRLLDASGAAGDETWVRFPEESLRAIVSEEDSQQPNGPGE